LHTKTPFVSAGGVFVVRFFDLVSDNRLKLQFTCLLSVSKAVYFALATHIGLSYSTMILSDCAMQN